MPYHIVEDNVSSLINNEMHFMTFKTWLEGLEEYEPFRPKITAKAAGRKFAFDNWWPQGEDVIYLPLDAVMTQKGSVEKDIEELLADFKGAPKEGLPAATHYELVDYKKGLAKPAGGKNQYKLFRILTAMEQQSIKQADEKFAAGQLSALKHAEEVKSDKAFFDSMKKDFINDPLRGASKAKLMVAISRNPHDLASMSTGRGWTSCMNLIDGSNKKSIGCEVKNGGFIAYLIRDNDPQIREPIARVHVRRFRNGKGENFAIPEDTVYGTDEASFVPAVKKWLKEKQGDIKTGLYARRGGEYSDTFGKSKAPIGLTPQTADPKYYERYLKRFVKMTPDQRLSTNNRKIIRAVYNDLIKYSNPAEIDAKVAKNFMQVAFPTFFGKGGVLFSDPIAGDICDYISHFKQAADKELIQKIIKKYNIGTPDQEPTIGNNCAKIIIKYFPDMLEPNQLGIHKPSFSSFYGKDALSDELRQQYGDMAIASLPRDLDVKSLTADKFVKHKEPRYHAVSDIGEILSLAGLNKHLPPDAIRTVIKFAKNIPQVTGEIVKAQQMKSEQPISPHTSKEVSQNLISSVFNLLQMTKADTPEVISYYQSLLPKMHELGGFGKRFGFPYALAQLEENGRPFLPYLYKILNLYERMQTDAVLKKNLPMPFTAKEYAANMEAVKHVIDRIENSQSYRTSGFVERPEGFSYQLEDAMFDLLDSQSSQA